jgi:hypothetical protein
MGGDAIESPTGGRGGERRVHDEEDRDDGYVPAPPRSPILGVLNVIGGEIDLAFVIEVGGGG